ncbi:MAG: hypothetical protein QJR14_10430 [Bacillota bacterium]|nr:hypothetical protein [Bacillota bacterium]
MVTGVRKVFWLARQVHEITFSAFGIPPTPSATPSTDLHCGRGRRRRRRSARAGIGSKTTGIGQKTALDQVGGEGTVVTAELIAVLGFALFVGACALQARSETARTARTGQGRPALRVIRGRRVA